MSSPKGNTLNTHILPTPAVSPFDSLRQLDDFGNEFWSARDLMPHLAYAQWKNFEVPLGRAMVAARNQGHSVEANFSRSRKVAIAGKMAQEDFQLTRFASYLVAMNGDPNKTEVAEAQAYFAIQTRVAEAQVQAIESPADLMARALIAAQDTLAAKDAAISAQRREIAAAVPKVAYVDAFVADTDLLKLRAVASRLNVGEVALRGLLIAKKWIYKETSSRWSESKQAKVEVVRYSAYAEKKHLFQPVMNHEAPRFKGETMHTLKVTPAGVSAIARLVNHAEEFAALAN